jgi:sugar lactone lactonase YvrE
MWKQCESRRRPTGSNAWLEPLESRTLMAGHGVSDHAAMTMDRTPPSQPTVTKLVTGLASGSGSTVGPNGHLYVTEGKTGRVLEIDPRTGRVSTFAEGLPSWVIGLGGTMDIEFVGGKAYVLETMVGPDPFIGGHSTVGIYRIDGPHSFTVVADIGTWSIAHRPDPSIHIFIESGVQYAMERYHGDLVVTDGHHNRVLRVDLDGDVGGNVSEVIAFPNIVPTGLAIKGDTVYMAQAGPIPHLPGDGKVVAFRPRNGATAAAAADVVASGARLLVDVEFGRGNAMYALSQGVHPGAPEGSPALPDTGSLVRANDDGTFTVVVDHLNQPTSMEFIGDTAYIVMLGGEVWRVDDVSGPPYGGGHDGGGTGAPHAAPGSANRAAPAFGRLLLDGNDLFEQRAGTPDPRAVLR